MVDYLSEAIILNILHRLPVKTLLRCTTICKAWYSLIKTPNFVHSHLNFTAKTPNLLLLRRCVRNSERYELYSENESVITRLEFPFRSINSFFTIVGSCNGLLCLSDDRVYFVHKIVMWNPCIRRSVVLPKPNIIYSSYGTFVQCLGFGFDPITSDYKVVRITYVDCAREFPQVEVYKLSTRKWEILSHLKLDYIIYNGSRQAYVNGAVHWIACCSNCYDLIVLFDMCHEVFRVMTLPVGLVDDNPATSKDLVVYNETLALILWTASRVGSSFCVWVMQEYGVEESWSKHLSFEFHDGFGGRFMKPLWVGKHGEVIAVGEDGRLVFYDGDGVDHVKDLISRSRGGSSIEEYQRSMYVGGYMESLVLLNL